jgi:hypothetical protein
MLCVNFFQKHEFEGRGDHVAVSAKVKGVPVFAVSWLDGTRKDIVSTCGTTLPGPALVRTRKKIYVDPIHGVYQENVEKSTPRCSLVARYFDNFHLIDVHDHMRQGVLGLEMHWRTLNWTHRIFGTLIGIIVTDTFYLHRAMFEEEMKSVSLLDFVDKLAFQLIFGRREDRTESYGKRRRLSTDSVPEKKNAPIPVLRPLLDLPYYQEKKAKNNKNWRAVKRCAIPGCKNDISFFCSECYDQSSPIARLILPFCNPANGQTCFLEHFMSVHLHIGTPEA